MFSHKSLCRAVLSLSASILLLNQVQAQEEIDNRGNIYGGISNYRFDSEWSQDNDSGWLIGGEIPVAERWGLSLEHWQVDSDIENAPGSADFKLTRIGPNFILGSKNGWQTYVGAGFGHLKQNISTGGGVSESTFDLGVGVKKFLTDNVFLRGDIKAIRTMNTNNWDEALNIGIGYAFGPKSRPVAAAPAAAPAATDPDSDGDGVADSRDKCPNTPRTLAVDATGCPIMETSMKSQDLLVNFDFDKSDIKPEYYARIAEFASFLTTYANTSAVIEGHTDSDGTDAYNQSLSERRARAVMTRLITAHGIAASRLSAVGFGEQRPVAENNNAGNKAKNRRIMAEVAVQVQEEKRR